MARARLAEAVPLAAVKRGPDLHTALRLSSCGGKANLLLPLRLLHNETAGLSSPGEVAAITAHTLPSPYRMRVSFRNRSTNLPAPPSYCGVVKTTSFDKTWLSPPPASS